MKVLLATDGSRHAEDAARLLSHLPHSKKLELTVLSVNYMHEIHGSLEVVEWMERNFEADKARSANACQRIEQMFQGADARVETVVREGHPGEMIIHEAHARDIEMVVMGAVGHSLFDRILIGSVSDFVTTHARCSVLVVRPGHLSELEHRSLNLCVAYDDSEPCKIAMQSLSEFEWSQNTKFDVVTVMTLPHMYSEVPIEVDTSEIKAATEKTAALGAQRLREISSKVESHVAESNHVGEGIVQFSSKKKSDLILMGDTGRGLAGRFFFGSASRYVLRHAPCSVWIGRRQSK